MTIVAPYLGSDPAVLLAPVPRVLHLIWVGSEVPVEVNEGWALWAEALPGWEVQRHTDGSGSWPLTAALTEQLNLHPVVLADIVRIEVVCRHGGVYVDSDTRPVEGTLQTLENHLESAFLTVMGHSSAASAVGMPWINTALFGFPARHPYVTWLWNNLPPRLPGGASPVASPFALAGPQFYRLAYRRYPDIRPRVLGREVLPDVKDKRWQKDPTDLARAVAVHLQAGAWFDWRER